MFSVRKLKTNENIEEILFVSQINYVREHGCKKCRLRNINIFLELTTGQDYLTVRAITTNKNREVKLAAKAFAETDMGLGIVASSEEQDD